MEAIKKVMEEFCEQCENRMVDLINAKVTPSSSKPPDTTPLVDENGVPIPEEGSHTSEGSKKNEIGYTYNNASNVQHPPKGLQADEILVRCGILDINEGPLPHLAGVKSRNLGQDGSPLWADRSSTTLG